jgi:predicted transcriptional regulator
MTDAPEKSADASRDLLRMTTDVVSKYLSNNMVATTQVPEFIAAVYDCFKNLGREVQPVAAEPPKPAVPVKKSIGDDYIICLEDGKKLKMLKRHLRTTYSMTPDEYRAKWGLPPDYPMVAPAYAAQRSAFAKKIGLGRVGGRAARGRK